MKLRYLYSTILFGTVLFLTSVACAALYGNPATVAWNGSNDNPLAKVITATAGVELTDTPVPMEKSATPFQPQDSPTSTPTYTPTFTATLTVTGTATVIPTLAPSWTATIMPLYSPTPSALPDKVLIENITGYDQTFNLTCEARTAVDMAGFFGVNINEMDFQWHLPLSDDPEEGFVGNYWDERGKLPPDSYGVHAYPVANLLRLYGLNAYDKKGVTLDEVLSEVASGRPVYVWIVAHTVPGTPVKYTATNGNTTVVVPKEHTALVIGYDSKTITLLDGPDIYQRSRTRFLESWGVLGNMAIFVNEPYVVPQPTPTP